MNGVLRIKDPASALTHMLGFLLAIAALAVLVTQAALHASAWHVVSFAIYGASLVLLFAASTVYHWLHLPPRGTLWLQRMDHIMIFLLIAGSYTPVCLVVLRGPWGWSLFGVAWGLATLGIVMKAAWMSAPDWLSTAFYLTMGWFGVVAVWPLATTLDAGGTAWLVAGGLSYSLGAVVYALERPNFHRWFDHHALWHVFVLGGAACHFAMMEWYILNVAA